MPPDSNEAQFRKGPVPGPAPGPVPAAMLELVAADSPDPQFDCRGAAAAVAARQSLHHQLGLAVMLACGKPTQNIAYMQGLGHVADIVRVWGWAWVMLFCPFSFCCGWLACCAALAFFPLVFGPSGASATPATKRCYLQCFVAWAFPGWLAGCSFWAAVSGGLWRARARPHVSLLGWGVGNMHKLTSHIIAQDTFLIQKT